MKTIILTRHAKSETGPLLANDFNRGLNERGKRDAPNMAARLVKRGTKVDLIVSSTAIRAKETALAIAKVLDLPEQNILWIEELYHAPSSTITEVIRTFDDQFKNILLVGHNPGITAWVNNQNGIITENMPTCCMAAFTSKEKTWANFPEAKKEMTFFDFPKNMI